MSNDQTRWNIPPSLVDPSEGQRNRDPVYPGIDGIPYRGDPYDRKENDPDHLQPKQGARVHVEILEMNKPEDRQRMEDIYSMFCNGSAVISAEERQWDEEIKSWRVFIRWADLYLYNPQSTQRGTPILLPIT